MNTSSITNLDSSYLQSIFGNALSGTAQSSSSSSTSGSTFEAQGDNGQLSPFAQLLSTLQQLQESNPTQYQQATQQIATNLQNAAQTATTDGNTTAASQLSQLATDFTNASQSGQLPNIQDLAEAVGGGGHHHHHHGGEVSTSGSNTSSTSSSSSSANSSSSSSANSSSSTSSTSSSSLLQQLLAAFESNATQNQSLNPLSIITNTLSSAGVTLES